MPSPHSLTPVRAAAVALCAGVLLSAAPSTWAQQAVQPAQAASTAPKAAAASVAPLEQRIDDAFITLFPMYEMARARFNATAHPLNPHPHPTNGTPFNARALIDHTKRDVTTPNNDTLYSATWLDLHAGPIRLRVPKVDAGRYWSLALLDMNSNNFAVLGSKAEGRGPLNVVLVGPGWKGPLPKGRVLRAPTNDVQFVGRFLVNGAADLPVVHRLQDGVSIAPLDPQAKGLPQWVPVKTSTDPENFLAVVNEMLSRNPPNAADARRLAAWADLGVGSGPYAFLRLPAPVQAAWQARLPVLHEQIKVGLQYGARRVNGWGVPSPHVGQFGDDYGLRAAVAYGGLSALPASEAVYLNLETDPSGAPLDGRKAWKLVVPPIEAKAFWSLSMYEKVADGRLFFSANPIGRYSIGDRTPGVKRAADGSLEILLQHEAPADTSNWLPTPAGPYAITLRAYLPTDAMRNGQAALPRLQPVLP